jgi:hypothetical protein
MNMSLPVERYISMTMDEACVMANAGISITTILRAVIEDSMASEAKAIDAFLMDLYAQNADLARIYKQYVQGMMLRVRAGTGPDDTIPVHLPPLDHATLRRML